MWLIGESEVVSSPLATSLASSGLFLNAKSMSVLHGGGSRFGANLFGVVVRYLRVLFRNGFRTGPRWLLWSYLALTAAAAVTGVQALGAAWELREGDG